MKKILFVAAATTLALSSCSDNEITTSIEKAKTPISINVYQQSQTRAVTETTLATIQPGFNFTVWDGTTALIDNKTARFENNAWTYGSDDAYWPVNSGTEVKFFGIYPSTINIDAANGKSTIPVDGTTDVVAAYVSQSLSNNTNNGTVSLAFSHVMAEVLVSAIGNNPDFTYSVTSITFSEPSTVDYTYEDNSFAVTTGATEQDFSYLATATSVSPQTMTELGTVVALPAMATTLTIHYTATDQQGVPNNLIKTADILELSAGSLNKINLTLPHDRTPLTFNVQDVPGWGDSNEQTPTLD